MPVNPSWRVPLRHNAARPRRHFDYGIHQKMFGAYRPGYVLLWLVPKGLCLIWSRNKKMRQSPMGVGAIDSIRSHREERSGINAHWRTAPVAEQVGGVWAAAENASWLPEK